MSTAVHVPTLKERIGASSPDELFKYIKALIYGEPGCLSGDSTWIPTNRGGNGQEVKLKHLAQRNLSANKNPTRIQGRYPDNFIRLIDLTQVVYSGPNVTYRVKTKTGKSIRVTEDHRFWTPDGWRSIVDGISDIGVKVKRWEKNHVDPSYDEVHAPYHPLRRSRDRIAKHRLMYEAYYLNEISYEDYLDRLHTGEIGGLTFLSASATVHHKDEDKRNNIPDNLELFASNSEHNRLHGLDSGYHHFGVQCDFDNVVAIEKYGEEETFDLVMQSEPYNNFVANDFVVHNSGKTYFFGSVEDDPDNFIPALLIDVDGGTATIRHRQRIDVKPIRKIEQLQNLYQEVAAEPDYYKSIGLDNLSELQKIDMNTVMQEAKESANNPDKVDIYVPSQREWGKSGERMRIIVRSFRDLPAHVFMFAHLEEREDQTTKLWRITPSLPGKLRHELSGFFDIVGMISTYEEPLPDNAGTEVKRQIQFAKTRRVAAKDRFNVLPQLMKDSPTIPQLWEAIANAEPIMQEADPLQALQGAVAQPTPTS